MPRQAPTSLRTNVTCEPYLGIVSVPIGEAQDKNNSFLQKQELVQDVLHRQRDVSEEVVLSPVQEEHGGLMLTDP